MESKLKADCMSQAGEINQPKENSMTNDRDEMKEIEKYQPQGIRELHLRQQERRVETLEDVVLLLEGFSGRAAALVRQAMSGAETYRQLRDVIGYVENGSDQAVAISQDDATREHIIKVGIDSPSSKVVRFSADSFDGAVAEAYAQYRQD